MHWGYSCACYERGIKTHTVVTYRILYPPCAGKMRDATKRCPGAGKCPFVAGGLVKAAEIRPPQGRTRGITKQQQTRRSASLPPKKAYMKSSASSAGIRAVKSR